MTPTPYRIISAEILRVLASRDVGKTMCPSEALKPELRTHKTRMEEVRKVAERMARAGKIEITQRGKKVEPGQYRGPIRLRLPRSAVPFDYAGVNFRAEPEKYRVARGEQGVLSVEPYKSEILPLWRFRTPEIAEASAKKILTLFKRYARARDFVGMDMARKFLQMGYTRARRYANHRSGQKYVGAVPTAMRGRSGAHGRKVAELEPDAEKARAAAIFKLAWDEVERNARYIRLRDEWKKLLG